MVSLECLAIVHAPSTLPHQPKRPHGRRCGYGNALRGVRCNVWLIFLLPTFLRVPCNVNVFALAREIQRDRLQQPYSVFESPLYYHCFQTLWCSANMSLMDETRYSQGGYKTVVVASVLIFMQFLMVFGRYCSRRLQKVMLEADDFVLLLATVRGNRSNT